MCRRSSQSAALTLAHSIISDALQTHCCVVFVATTVHTYGRLHALMGAFRQVNNNFIVSTLTFIIIVIVVFVIDIADEFIITTKQLFPFLLSLLNHNPNV